MEFEALACVVVHVSEYGHGPSPALLVVGSFSVPRGNSSSLQNRGSATDKASRFGVK